MPNVKQIKATNTHTANTHSQITATVESISCEGVPYCKTSDGGLLEAKIALNTQDYKALLNLPCEVVLLVPSDATQMPIITHIIQPLKPQEPEQKPLFNGIDIKVDGRHININAKEEVVLECGKSSIRLKRDGKIIIKGTEIISRSSGSHKIKGGTVNIN